MKKLNKKILIIEDEQSLRISLQDTFIAEGFEVLAASDGKQGLKLALENIPDIILLDILMPKMDGVAMLKKLRKNKKCLAIPVVLLTNLSYDKEVKEAIKYGATDFLVKANWKLEDVIKKVKQRLCLK
ncbi:response regulator [Candidatus Falkowbacteria bacterium CG11_big_fil_rev_8_21_14_0_20_39_10]|uniref:Response regulator n=1 Tax=Candidatus Falkowbacteria bacterium CG11_big_fil_rev_8_21_14_0_20_39_10 TaxID=1974570 RepID=A0A2M6KA60_9BACT|nr:MAG: response regulator [Candidatus Falkowbacteria bacterium CG11_big_fil_rev_8_21_14_0_20_39_10]